MPAGRLRQRQRQRCSTARPFANNAPPVRACMPGLNRHRAQQPGCARRNCTASLTTTHSLCDEGSNNNTRMETRGRRGWTRSKTTKSHEEEAHRQAAVPASARGSPGQNRALVPARAGHRIALLYHPGRTQSTAERDSITERALTRATRAMPLKMMAATNRANPA
jgi:Tfp pilus assembly protein PilX